MQKMHLFATFVQKDIIAQRLEWKNPLISAMSDTIVQKEVLLLKEGLKMW